MGTDKRDANGKLHDGNNGWFKSEGASSPTKEEAQSMSANELSKRLAHKTAGNNTVEIKQPRTTIIEGHYSCYSSLSKKERAKWFNAVGEIKRGMWTPTSEGLALVQIGKKIIYTNPDYNSPSIKRIVEFKTQAQTDKWLERIHNGNKKR